MVHFVGFRGEEYHSAVKIWGLPDFYHYYYDMRAIAERVPGDVMIFANKAEQRLNREHSYNDSEHF